MPLVANSNLPSFQRLRNEGETVIPEKEAVHQDIRELHIGLLNMMPDKALAATERQFFRLVGESNQIAQFYVHPFTLDALERSSEGQAHVEQYYESFEHIRENGLDALIITGANVIGRELSVQPFWKPLIEIIDWAFENVTSTLCSCLATHAVLQFRYGLNRRALPAKRWGVYSHNVTDTHHPLVTGMNTRFDVPHSRFNQIDGIQFREAELQVLVESDEAGVHLGVSEDGFRLVFCQGHPEYDVISLMKEYKREVGCYINAERDDYPVFPENYFDIRSRAILEEYRDRVESAVQNKQQIEDFPEGLIIPRLHNTWHDSAEAVINNWIGKVYQLTHVDRRVAFRDGIDPCNPLGL
ncbi:MAG: homoserine O-succinyltransferase [Thiotrichales bacterium]|nr:homoserine O-succinyltransferase [Thiotrichales bacterium]